MTGLSEHTLRYYERIGLIEGVNRAGNGHRKYTSTDIGWIEFLKKLRSTGMPIAQMIIFAELTRAGNQTMPDRVDILQAHRVNVVCQLENLQEFLAILNYKIDYYTQESKKLLEPVS
jgi:DNA-binding transcriptional MerR regulator